MTTIKASTTVGVSLDPAAYTSPIVVGAGVTITNPGYPDGIYAGSASSTFFAIQNDGTVIGASTISAAGIVYTPGAGGLGFKLGAGITAGLGIYLTPGGAVTNAATASISAFVGIDISGGLGTVVNAGYIQGADVITHGFGTYAIGSGVLLESGGSVTNTASASVVGGSYGIKIMGTTGTVLNNGSIVGENGGGTLGGNGFVNPAGAVVLDLGGVVTNQAGALITSPQYSVFIPGGTGTVVNDGNIDGVVRVHHGSVTNAVAGSISRGITMGLGGSMGAVGTVINDGTITAVQHGIFMFGSSGRVVNAGKITGNVQLGSGSTYTSTFWSVTNTTGGLITSNIYNGGIFIYSAPGTVVNSGGITEAEGAGIFLKLGGAITNAASGSIMGATYGVKVIQSTGTVINDGSLMGTGVNGIGAYLGAGGTLTNAGSIIGNGGTAITFGGTGHNLLVLDAGFGFSSGAVVGSSSASNTLELASTGSAGTVTGLGTQFQHFGSIAIDAGAEWLLAGVQRGLAGPISGFARGDTIELTGLTEKIEAYSAGILTLTGDATVKLDLPGTFTKDSFLATPVAGGTDVTEVCFLAGTRILTPRGEVPVEQLAAGDLVRTQRGETHPIAWIGSGRVLAPHGGRTAAGVVIVRKDALDENVPNRDLRVTKGHSLYIDGLLVPVEGLINHRTIRWDEAAREATIYHVELDAHDVLLANGAPAESYRDDGNRWLFQNANSGWKMPPKPPCARILTGGPELEAIWRRLLHRAGLRPGCLLTEDPDLHLLVDGKRIDPIERRDGVHVFYLGERSRNVRMRSRAATPRELGVGPDPRSLGVAIRRIVLAQAQKQRIVEAEAVSLTDGYHAFEPGEAIRWTNGDAAVPVELLRGVRGPCMLLLHLGPGARYLAEEVEKVLKIA